ncbi:MAG: GAF domain-containing protein [Anaerolineae bacterium]|nr:GAF domain-containing protein [Anaerolineae bacterium]
MPISVKEFVGRIFNKREIDYWQELLAFSRIVASTLDLERLLDIFAARTGELLGVTHVLIYLYDAEFKEYTLRHIWGDRRLSAVQSVRFRERDSLVMWLAKANMPLILRLRGAKVSLPGLSTEERARIELLEARACAPLFAKEQLIGWLALGPKVTHSLYTTDDLAFLGALADQAVMAIENARLHAHSESRARELRVLYELGQSISSTLDLDTVLNLIVSKVVGLLAVEYGVLWVPEHIYNQGILQEQVNLIPKVAVGQNGQEKTTRQLRLGEGVAGRVAQGHYPLIVNSAHSDLFAASTFDEVREGLTHSILAAPLMVQEHLVGVIEVIDRIDGRPFIQEDLKLLVAFAAQAAIAVENAQLFTQIDHDLQERVEELMVLQQIDQQLNASLDFEHVIEIALHWALRITRANTGCVGMVDPEGGGLLFVALEGYPDELEIYRHQPWPLDKGIVGRVARTGKPALVRDVAQSADYVAVLPKASAQISVPIFREGNLLGIISLESELLDAFNEQHLQHLLRLAEHVAVAMTNASLYTEVKNANQAKTAFVSMVSHELKGPMTSIRGYADLLRMGTGGEINAQQQAFLEVIIKNVSYMKTLVYDLLDISRIESGHLHLDMRAVQLQSVLDEVLYASRHSFETRQQTLHLQIPEQLTAVKADRMRLSQILTNLISNASKYTPEGGEITITAKLQEEFVSCSVRDTGIGISPKDLSRLFQKFFRASNEYVRGVSGTGLGLSITKQLVELQGGKIWVNSELEKGSTFTFTLSVADAEQLVSDDQAMDD